MKETPIPFCADMARAILEGRKTQTRRVIKNPKRLEGLMLKGEEPEWCPYGGVGDRLWVREAFQIQNWCYPSGWTDGTYLADNQPFAKQLSQREVNLLCNRKHPYCRTAGRFMYKSLARIWLEITRIRVDRVQVITEEDAMSEGVGFLLERISTGHFPYGLPQLAWAGKCRGKGRMGRYSFSALWDSLNAKRDYGWDKNPYVWVIEFKRMATKPFKRKGEEHE